MTDEQQKNANQVEAMRESGQLAPIRERLQTYLQPDLAPPPDYSGQAVSDALWLDDYAFALEHEVERLNQLLEDVDELASTETVEFCCAGDGELCLVHEIQVIVRAAE